MNYVKLLTISMSMFLILGCDGKVVNLDDADSQPNGAAAGGETSSEMAVTNENDGGENYVVYNQKNFETASDSKRVLFFHAVWCPTCKVANEEFSSDEDKIPDDVIVFKVDYDTEEDLKEKYGITYQHTFVYVDENGEEITKWNGGGIDELNQNI